MIDLSKKFSMERVNSETLKIYGNNKHKHNAYRIISCFSSGFWHHKDLRYSRSFLFTCWLISYVTS